MSIPWICTLGSASEGQSQSAVRFGTAAGGSNTITATEAAGQWVMRGTYTASNLYARITGVNGTSTLITRKNNANGAQSVSMSASGTFEDTTHTDSLADGNQFGYQLTVGGSHNNNINWNVFSVLLDDGGSNIPVIGGAVNRTAISTSTTNYLPLYGCGDSANTTEANAEYTVRSAATLSNLRTYLVSSTGTVTCTVRKNSADGNLTVSYGSSVTGAQEDTTHSDSFSVGDRMAIKINNSTTIELDVIQAKASCGNRVCGSTRANGGGSSFTGAATWFLVVESCASALIVTEADSQTKARAAQVISNFYTNVNPNTRSDANSITFRVNSADSALGVSIPASTTGVIEDNSDSVTLATTDLIALKIVTGSGSGSFTLRGIAFQQGALPSTNTLDMWNQPTNQLPRVMPQVIPY